MSIKNAVISALQDLSSVVCKSIKELEHVTNVGNQNRAVGYVQPTILYSYKYYGRVAKPECPNALSLSLSV